MKTSQQNRGQLWAFGRLPTVAHSSAVNTQDPYTHADVNSQTMGNYGQPIFTPQITVFPAAPAMGRTPIFAFKNERLMQTFHCKFSNSVTCTARFTDAPPTSDRSHVIGIEWTGQPNRVVIRKYVRWMNTVQQTMADQWGVSLLYVYQLTRDPSGWVKYAFTPGGRPRKVTA